MVSFSLDSRPDKRGDHPIRFYVRTCDGHPFQSSVGYSIAPEKWDPARQRVRPGTATAPTKNGKGILYSEINGRLSDISKAFESLVARPGMATREALESALHAVTGTRKRDAETVLAYSDAMNAWTYVYSTEQIKKDVLSLRRAYTSESFATSSSFTLPSFRERYYDINIRPRRRGGSQTGAQVIFELTLKLRDVFFEKTDLPPGEGYDVYFGEHTDSGSGQYFRHYLHLRGYVGQEILDTVGWDTSLLKKLRFDFSDWNDCFYYVDKMDEPDAAESDMASFTIPDGVESIGSGAFSRCRKLREIQIPEGVIEIRERAFYGCCGLQGIRIPDSVKKVGWRAFDGCHNLKEISILEGLDVSAAYLPAGTHITERPFSLPDNIEKVGFKSLEGRLRSSLKLIRIPDSVTEIEASAFQGCSGLSEIKIPDNVSIIGVSAFKGCSGLKEVIIPDSVTRIGDKAFSGCTRLKSIRVPGRIDDTNGGRWRSNFIRGVFDGCCNLESISVSPGRYFDSRDNCNAIIQTYRNELLLGCKNTLIPESVVGIGEKAFFRCKGLKAIIIPDNVRSIGVSAFDSCVDLTEIHLSSNLTKIGRRAFKNCSRLKKLYIPDHVKSIGNIAFKGCSSLTEISIPISLNVSRAGLGPHVLVVRRT